MSTATYPYRAPGAGFPSLGHFLQAVAEAGRSPHALDSRLRLHAAASGLGSDVPEAGGFAVVTELASAVWTKAYETGEILRRCTRFPLTTGEKLRVPVVDETSRADGSRLGGVRFFWIDGDPVVLITAAKNDKLDFTEGVSGAATATIAAGFHTADSLARTIQVAMDAAATDNTYTVTFDRQSAKFTIARATGTATFSLLWNTGPNDPTSIGESIGFDTSTDDTGRTSYTSDASIPIVPRTKPKLGTAELKTSRAVALVPVTNELLRSAGALEAFVNAVLPDEFAATFESQIAAGNGVGKPLGVTKSPATITVSKEAGQAADTLVWKNVRKMWSRLWTASKRSDATAWLIDQTIEDHLYDMTIEVGTTGAPVFQPGGSSPDSPYATLFGRPVIPYEFGSVLGDLGDIVLVDLAQYIIAEAPPRSELSMHVKFEEGESVFRFVFDVDGEPGWAAAVTPRSGGATQSPFVMLEERA